MRYCFYRTPGSDETRVGASVEWDDRSIIDVNRAEVVWLAERTGSRRAHEIAGHLVPADPSKFLAAGAAVWEFSREAAIAASPDATTSRGEPVTVRAADVERVDVVDFLAGIATEVGEADDTRAVDHALAVIVRRGAYCIDRADVWSVAAGVITQSRSDWIVTPDDLGDERLKNAVADMVSDTSRLTPLESGDVLCSRAVAAVVRRREMARVAA